MVLVEVGDAIQDNQIDVFAKDKKYYKDHPIPKVLNEMAYSANEPTVGKSLVKPSLTFNKFVATISRQIEIASNVQGFISIKQ